MRQIETGSLVLALQTISLLHHASEPFTSAAIKEGAERLERFRAALEAIRETGDAGLAAIALDPGPEGRGEEPLPW